MADTEAIEVARRINDEFASVLIDPEVEVDVGEFPGGAALAGGGGRGFGSYLRFWKEWLEPWEDLRFEPTNHEAAGSRGEHALVLALAATEQAGPER